MVRNQHLYIYLTVNFNARCTHLYPIGPLLSLPLLWYAPMYSSAANGASSERSRQLYVTRVPLRLTTQINISTSWNSVPMHHQTCLYIKAFDFPVCIMSRTLPVLAAIRCLTENHNGKHISQMMRLHYEWLFKLLWFVDQPLLLLW